LSCRLYCLLCDSLSAVVTTEAFIKASSESQKFVTSAPYYVPVVTPVTTRFTLSLLSVCCEFDVFRVSIPGADCQGEILDVIAMFHSVPSLFGSACAPIFSSFLRCHVLCFFMLRRASE
jgi:hypothetical protein